MAVINRRKKPTQESTAKGDEPPIRKKRQNKSKQANNWLPILTILISAGLSAGVYFLQSDSNLTPFHKPGPNASSHFTSEQVDNRKWGTLRSGHYFGLKTLAERPLVFGLLWFDSKLTDRTVRIRHWCDQADGLTKYGWLRHDFHSFGTQEIVDDELSMTTSFLIDHLDEQNRLPDQRRPSRWRARVEIDFNAKIKQQIEQQEKRANSTRIRMSKEISLVPYFAVDASADDPDELWIAKEGHQVNGRSTVFEASGRTKVFPNGFRGRITVNSNDLLYSNALNSSIDPPLLQVKETLMASLALTGYPGQEANRNKYLIVLREPLKNDKHPAKANLALQQVIIKVPSTIEIEFEELPIGEPTESDRTDYSAVLNEKVQEFDAKFEQTFRLKEKGFVEEQISFARSALSNMLGSIGSFNGYSQVSLAEDRKLIKPEERKIHKYGPLKLLTSVPSRSFFPRGFLWDEGFHQLLISKYDRNLSETILSSWFRLMNRNGWIPREVILGSEAEARVPDEFVVQNVHVANPPTFFLAIDAILGDLSAYRTDQSKQQLSQLLHTLIVWYDWFNRTQSGAQPGSYRWRGRNAAVLRELNVKTLSSGLDDYPRASTPTDDEMHVDLFSWMTYAARVLARLSNHLKHSSYERFNGHFNWLSTRLDALHWSAEKQMYCDVGLHSGKVILKPVRTADDQRIEVRTELEPARFGCVNEFGYVSLFPFLLQLIEPNSPQLGVVLSKLRDPKLIWSDFGLRSLAQNSPYYNAKNTEHDPPYWRSAIWMNINYLALRSLDHYSKQAGPYREKAGTIYGELKANLIGNVFKQYKSKNYLFENYDDRTGQGKGCYPFTGWTALVVLMMADQ